MVFLRPYSMSLGLLALTAVTITNAENLKKTKVDDANVDVEYECDECTLISIKLGDTPLATTDYTTAEKKITILKAKEGKYTVTFNKGDKYLDPVELMTVPAAKAVTITSEKEPALTALEQAFEVTYECESCVLETVSLAGTALQADIDYKHEYRAHKDHLTGAADQINTQEKYCVPFNHVCYSYNKADAKKITITALATGAYTAKFKEVDEAVELVTGPTAV